MSCGRQWVPEKVATHASLIPLSSYVHGLDIPSGVFLKMPVYRDHPKIGRCCVFHGSLLHIREKSYNIYGYNKQIGLFQEQKVLYVRNRDMFQNTSLVTFFFKESLHSVERREGAG